MSTNEPSSEKAPSTKTESVTTDTLVSLRDEVRNLKRELQLEAALQKVRTASLSMIKSKEISKVVVAFFYALKELDVKVLQAYISVFHMDREYSAVWFSPMDDFLQEPFFIKIPFQYLPVNLENWKNGEEFSFMSIQGKKKTDEFMKNLSAMSGIEEFAKMQAKFNFTQIESTEANHKFGNVSITQIRKSTKEEKYVLSRIAKVFEGAYIRFLDLQKHEAQLRDAQIEVALERVRASAQSMQKSSDYTDVIKTSLEQMLVLGIPALEVTINTGSRDLTSFDYYAASITAKGGIKTWVMKDNEGWDTAKYHWLTGDDAQEDVSLTFEGEALHIMLADLERIKRIPAGRITGLGLKALYMEISNLSADAQMNVSSIMPVSKKAMPILKRISAVLGGSYTRFLDLQKSEALAAEAKLKNEELAKSYQNLKDTQSQLIQAEKMASLGALTAGIAHEIQNPLNFVNNFSELSIELVDEIEDELKNNDLDEVRAILEDLRVNMKKINHHGTRASSIVIGMLDHSRTDSNDKVDTDINSLGDEYLRLSYHGLRAKDKSFNANFETDLDESLTTIKVKPQQLGRVLLNLLNNAFYAVQKRKQLSKDPSYKPTVRLITKKLADQVVLSVEDNGIGMSAKVQSQIFEPFFTTKPAGSGTGLGMSLSYDIIANGHGGKIAIESKEGVGTRFDIFLPLIG